MTLVTIVAYERVALTGRVVERNVHVLVDAAGFVVARDVGLLRRVAWRGARRSTHAARVVVDGWLRRGRIPA